MSTTRPEPDVSLSGAIINGFVAPIGGIVAFIGFLEGEIAISVLLGMVAVLLVLVQRVYSKLVSIERRLETDREVSTSDSEPE
jgi:hypothetical protein